ncbi:DUF4189 domain-containing protein [Rhizobium sp.]
MTRLNLLFKAAIIATLGLSFPAAASAANYGAIAYSQRSGAYGWSTNFRTQRAAEQGAMARCRERANDCRIAVWFRDACGALAVGGDGGWGADWGRNLRAAENKAANVCSGYSYNCRIVVSKCNSGS